jgi:hypothetical protein
MRDSTYIKYIKDSKLLAESTKKLYLKQLNIIKTDIWLNCKSITKIGKGKCLDYIINHPEAFLEKLDVYVKNKKGRLDPNRLSIHSVDAYVSVIRALFKHVPGLIQKETELYKKWIEIHKEVLEPINVKYLSNKPTERDEKAYVPFEELEKKRDELKEGSMERLLLSMYTMIPPVRSDYDKIKIYTDIKDKEIGNINDENYMILDNNNKKYFIILQKYKTSKTYKTLHINIPPNLLKEIALSLKSKPRKYLFVDRNNKPYDKSNTFNRWANRKLKDIFGKKEISLRTIRHIYISRRDLKLEEKSGLQRIEIANKMGHSLNQQQKYLWHSFLREKNDSYDIKEKI